MSIVALPIMFLLALVVLGVVAGFIVLLSHPKTRKGMLIVLPIVGLIAVLIVAVLFHRIDFGFIPRVNSQPQPTTHAPAKPVANASDNASWTQVYETLTQKTPVTAPVATSPNPTPVEAMPKSEDDISQAAASKTVSVLQAVARVIGRALAEEEKILAAKKEAASATAPAPPSRPAWVGTPAQLVGDAYQMSISIGPYTTREECDAALPEKLQAALGRYVEACLGDQTPRDISLPPDYLRQQLVKAEWQETRPYSVGPMTELHVLLQFDRKVKDRVLEAYREAAVTDRLQAVAGWAALGLSLLAVCFAYLKTDLVTGGLYRGRLRFATGVAILGLVAAAVVAVV